MKRLPKAIQIFFTDERNGEELAHDYYLNAAWVTDLCDRYGAANVGMFIHRSIEAKRKACIKRSGIERQQTAIMVDSISHVCDSLRNGDRYDAGYSAGIAAMRNREIGGTHALCA